MWCDLHPVFIPSDPIFHFRVGAHSLPVEQGRIEEEEEEIHHVHTASKGL